MPLHQTSDSRAGERVPLQHVLDTRASPRDQPQCAPHGQTSQNLVSEPTDEAEEDESRKPNPRVVGQLQFFMKPPRFIDLWRPPPSAAVVAYLTTNRLRRCVCIYDLCKILLITYCVSYTVDVFICLCIILFDNSVVITCHGYL